MIKSKKMGVETGFFINISAFCDGFYIEYVT